MKKVNETVEKVYGNYPEKILQFGEGNFLRAFADWMIDNANEAGDYQGSVVLCQPIAQGMGEVINSQDGVYTLVMRGIEDGEPVEKTKKITSVSRCINPYENYEALMELARSADLEVVISNTTEAGIAYREGDKLDDAPPASFPAKVTAFLYERYKAFNGDPARGLLFLPVELIDHNGENLKRIVLQYAAEWDLGPEFIRWVDEDNHFTSTLVDRIVTGYPRDEAEAFAQKLGYEDNVIVTSELFNLWVIQGKKEWSDILPIHKHGGNVIWTEDVTPYRTRKVRILNGGHTGTVLAAYLSGHNIVLDLMNDNLFKTYLDKMLFQEIIPTLDLPKEELEEFAGAVGARFANPYIKHNLLDISLNSCSKFNARCLPSLLAYVERMGKLPKLLTFSLAAFIKFYQGRMEDGVYMGCRADGTKYQIRDDAEVLDFFSKVWEIGTPVTIAAAVLSNESFWSGRDLTEVEGLADAVAGYLSMMETSNIADVIQDIL
ncbi:tagaturonate reductase [Anaerolentibacter hominis]|uniref:tagaturonate reductase n=1 Tax=Anaerolentibacter hominis TaxID=3079009 RepID=UPI0031B810E9